MIAFIDGDEDQKTAWEAVFLRHRDAYGVEPICRVLPIAPSAYHEHIARRRDPALLSARARQDAVLKPEVARVFAENSAVCGVRKVWRQMMREGFPIARCTVARLMREMGLAGVIRGKPVRTTISDKEAPARLITSTASSPRQRRTCCGYRTSPASRPGRGSSISPSSSIPMLGASLAGGPAGRPMQVSSLTP